MFITSIIENSKGCIDLIVIGYTIGLEETWLLVLASHAQHSPPLALYSNLKPNGFLHPCQIHPGNETCQFVCCSFHFQYLTFMIHGKIHTPVRKENLGYTPIVLYDLGIHLSPHLRAPHNSMPYIRHYIPQVLGSCKRTKLRKDPFQKLLLILTLNEATIP